MKGYPTRTGALCANSHPGSYTGQDAFNDMLPVIERNMNDLLDKSGYLPISEGWVSSSLMARDYKFVRDIVEEKHMKGQQRQYILRRLTPTECARLQGFPDSLKIPVSDTQAYRQFGNSVVVPLMTEVAKIVIRKMKELDGARYG